MNASAFRRAITLNTLRSCQLFAGLPASDLEAIAAFIVPKQLGKGDFLFHEGDTSAGFYVVQKGAINLHRVSAAGKEQVLHLFCPVESFAEGTFAGTGTYPANARATEPTTVLHVPKTEFTEMLRRRPELSLRMLGAMSQHLRVLVSLVEDLTLKDAETRLANWLLRRCPRPLRNSAVEIPLGRTKRVLAAEMGTTSETLSRLLAKFRDHKLVQVNGKSITITRPLDLQKLLDRHLGEG
jgi:CRP/FNR family transcriptional regulator, dissimilatory nitrate respiration regulator